MVLIKTFDDLVRSSTGNAEVPIFEGIPKMAYFSHKLCKLCIFEIIKTLNRILNFLYEPKKLLKIGRFGSRKSL